MILRETPFYAESGGQIGDSGFLQAGDARFDVSDTTKTGGAFLHHTDGRGGAGTMFDRQSRAERGDFLVRLSERQVQEAQRIDHGLGRVPETLDEDLARDLRGAFAFRVSAHAVQDEQQRRVIGNRGGDAVLVVLACSAQADLGVLGAQQARLGLNCPAL